MKALVLMVKPNPKAPLLAWAAHPYLMPRAVLVGYCAPGGPPSRSPLALPFHASSSGAEGWHGHKAPLGLSLGWKVLESSLQQDPGSPGKHTAITTTATAQERPLGALSVALPLWV